MSTCHSCGGTLGVDCFNPQECMAITQDMARQYQQQGDVTEEIRLLREQLEQLTADFANTPIDEQFVKDVAKRVDFSPHEWDSVDHLELCRAVLSIAVERKVRQ